MFEGHFDLKKFSARGLTDADFTRAIKEGRLDALLKELPLVQRCKGNNRIFDNMAGYLLCALFQAGNCGWPYYSRDAGASQQAALWGVCLLTTDGATSSYTEDYGDASGSGRTIDNVWDTIGGTEPGKLFEEEQIYQWVIGTDLEATGRESVYFRNHFLWLPTEGVTGTSTPIKSIGLHYSDDGDNAGGLGYYNGRARIGRIRLKDENGLNATVVKNSSEVLFLEYTFQMVSM